MALATAAGSERELNKATVRVLQVLSSFATEAPAFGVTELSQLLGMTKNMTYRALSTLVEQGYLMRDGQGARYRLGYRVLELQSPLAVEPDLRTLCAPYVRRLQAATGESVSLCVRALDHCVLIDGVETRRPGVWRVRVGDLLPLFGTAAGRVMLAFMSDAWIDDYVARHRPLRHPRTGEQISADDLWQQIARIREQGFCRVIRASTPPMDSVGFPIRDVDGGLHGAISVGGPAERFTAQLDKQLPELLEIAQELNKRTRLFSANATGSELN
jgi:DNA-binding IclR family transcriptional regulator